ncbi:MAG: ABC transporter ATP-binding protein [Candidatus Dormibacteraeota bacterium]|nr:ABC transporter ATP-binding protein [Candidatus Dormibacteraeota bacterium]
MNAPAEPATVRLEGVVKRFNTMTAVDNLDLEVDKGEFFSMLGPSGCGKTTTLRIIAGFEQPDEGSVFLEGRSVENTPPYRRNVNTVFQSYALFEHLNVWDNVAFGLRRKKVPEEEIRQRVGDMLDLVRLKQKATNRPRQLSGGQQQRVALARALVNMPAVLLLDEPLGALDLQLRKQMQIELKQIQRTVGITFVYVTHDQEEALTMSDRIAVMSEGVLQQCGTPEEIYELPANVFVAGFIGISNLLPGEVEDRGVRLKTGELIPAELADGIAAGDTVFVCVRPEKLRLGAKESGQVSIEGIVVETVYLGTATQYLVELAPGLRLVAIENNVHTASSDHRISRGSKVTVGWLPEHGRVLRS